MYVHIVLYTCTSVYNVYKYTCVQQMYPSSFPLGVHLSAIMLWAGPYLEQEGWWAPVVEEVVRPAAVVAWLDWRTGGVGTVARIEPGATVGGGMGAGTATCVGSVGD